MWNFDDLFNNLLNSNNFFFHHNHLFDFWDCVVDNLLDNDWFFDFNDFFNVDLD
jgi:hypothetical protein